MPGARRFYPTDRDRQIVRAVYTHRALTSDQVSLLFWGTPKANTRSRRRLRLLSDNGYLERAEQPVTLAEGRRPLVYFLDKGGVETAAHELGVDPAAIDWKPSYNNVKWLFLEHLLSTNDIRVRLEHAAPTRVPQAWAHATGRQPAPVLNDRAFRPDPACDYSV